MVDNNETLLYIYIENNNTFYLHYMFFLSFPIVIYEYQIEYQLIVKIYGW